MPRRPLWKRWLGPPYRKLREKLYRLHPRRAAALLAWAAATARAVRARRREQRLTVAVDVAAFWEPLTGVGWYLDRVLRQLADRDDLRLRLYGEDLVSTAGFDAPTTPLPAGRAIEVVRYEVPEDTLLPPGPAVRLLRRLAPLLIAADGNHVVFAPNFYPPRRFEPALGLTGARLVATIHDLAFRRVAWSVDERTLDLLFRRLDRVLRDAARIVTPSAAVRGELAREGRVPPARIRAIHHGPGQLSAVGATAPPGWAPARYGLFVGTIEPRKNLETLLTAWRLVRRSLGGEAPALVVCGRFGWRDEALRREIAAGEAEGWLHHPGYVANEELAGLYRGALVLAFPSHYEGFGLPILEAFAAGAPVVASDLPVLREVAGEAALYAPARDVAAWVRHLTAVLDDPGLARRLAAAGQERAQRFSWELAAETHVEVFRQAGRAGT